MTDLVERVARVIYEADDPWAAAFPWPNLNPEQTQPEQYRAIARTAIAEMMKPTPMMIIKGIDASDYIDELIDGPTGEEFDYDTGMKVHEIYQAMIDAALKETKQ